jgi:lycopene beta-cyclase
MPELLECVASDWKVTDVFFGGSFDTPFDDRIRLDRGYLQASRTRARERIPQP